MPWTPICGEKIKQTSVCYWPVVHNSYDINSNYIASMGIRSENMTDHITCTYFAYKWCIKSQVTVLVFSLGYYSQIYILFADWEVRIMKNCDWGLENVAQGHRPWAAFPTPRSQYFTIRTDPKPVNNFFFFPSTQTKKKKHSQKKLMQALLWLWSEIGNLDQSKNQSDCRIRYRAHLEKIKYLILPM